MKKTLLLVFVFLAAAGSVSASDSRSQERPLAAFSVLSDVHIGHRDKESHRRLTRALRDYAAINPHSDLLVLNGDMTDGTEPDYLKLFELLGNVSHAPVHATMGNHEFYQMWVHDHQRIDYTRLSATWSGKQAIRLVLKYFRYDEPYHELWINGFHFLFLSGEAYRDEDATIGEDAYLSERQLAWLEERLLPHAAGAVSQIRKPVFVFLHQPLPFTVAGSEKMRGVVQHKQLRALLERYPQTVLFTGHTHKDLEMPKQIVRTTFLAVGTSSVRKVRPMADNPAGAAKSQSVYVEVYADKVIIRGREHSNRSWVGKPYVVSY